LRRKGGGEMGELKERLSDMNPNEGRKRRGRTIVGGLAE